MFRLFHLSSSLLNACSRASKLAFSDLNSLSSAECAGLLLLGSTWLAGVGIMIWSAKQQMRASKRIQVTGRGTNGGFQ